MVGLDNVMNIYWCIFFVFSCQHYYFNIGFVLNVVLGDIIVIL